MVPERLVALLSRIRHRIDLQSFVAQTKLVRDLEAPACDPAGPIVVSMLSGRDLHNYLIAIHSFMRWIRPSRIFIVDDGTLSRPDKAFLASSFPFSTIVQASDVPKRSIQSGGTWERLALIAHLNRDAFVVQLDSDILTCRRPDAVVDALSTQRSFVLRGDPAGPEIEDMRTAATRADSMISRQMQVAAERALRNLPDSHERLYVRGCSGFAGFAAGTLDLDALELVHEEMRGVCGDRWFEWGSEQVASNIVLANAANAIVLPDHDYTTHFNDPNISYDDATLIHFIGVARYKGATYSRLARTAVNEMIASKRA